MAFVVGACYSRQDIHNAIPVFLKRAKGAWEYLGRYRVARPPSSDPALLRHKEQQAQRTDLAMVLYLESHAQR